MYSLPLSNRWTQTAGKPQHNEICCSLSMTCSISYDWTALNCYAILLLDNYSTCTRQWTEWFCLNYHT